MKYGEVEKYIGKYLYHVTMGKVKVLRRTRKPRFVVYDEKRDLHYGSMGPEFLSLVPSEGEERR